MYEVFERLMRERGISPSDVSRATGINKSTLSAWKNGSYLPKADKLYAIAQYFGVPMEVFFEDPNVIYGKPVYCVSAGRGCLNEGYPADSVNAEEDSDEYSWCEVRGDSMYPVLLDGDFIRVHHQTEVSPKDLAVVKINGDEATCKHVEIVNDGIWLRAENKEVFADRHYSVQEVLTLPITIIGKVIELKRML